MNTPETDALISVGLENADRECVPAEFARKLERERDEAREERDKMQTELEMWRDGNIIHLFHRDELEKTERERDEARERERVAIASWDEERQRALREGERVLEARRERDEAWEALKKCREDSICYAEHMRRCGYVAAYKESTENADIATIILNKLKEGAK
jgi:hypothetical protein